MSKLILPKNHFSLGITEDVAAICQPFSKYGISVFAYTRCYDDGSIFALMSNKEMYINHFEKGFGMGPYISENIIREKFYYIPMPARTNIKFSKAFYEYKDKFKLTYPIYFFERHSGYVDMFTFSSRELNIINFYLNNLDLLEGFKCYFRDKANKLIQNSNKNRLLVPKHMRLNFTGLSPNDEVTNNINLLKGHMDNINYYLKLHFNTILSRREIQSLSYLMKGRTAMETAKELNISPKTVEFYIDSVKSKFNCLSRADLFDKVIRAKLTNIITKL